MKARKAESIKFRCCVWFVFGARFDHDISSSALLYNKSVAGTREGRTGLLAMPRVTTGLSSGGAARTDTDTCGADGRSRAAAPEGTPEGRVNRNKFKRQFDRGPQKETRKAMRAVQQNRHFKIKR